VQEFEIKPLVGIGPVQIGMGRAEVRAILTRIGGGEMRLRSPECDTFFESSFQVHYDSEDSVEFIETASHPAFRTMFDRHALHEMPVEAVVELTSKTAPGRWDGDSTFTVPALQLAFWRAVSPEPDQDPDDPDGRYFDSIGAGRLGLFWT
jgi:hypothetical protein